MGKKKKQNSLPKGQSLHLLQVQPGSRLETNQNWIKFLTWRAISIRSLLKSFCFYLNQRRLTAPVGSMSTKEKKTKNALNKTKSAKSFSSKLEGQSKLQNKESGINLKQMVRTIQLYNHLSLNTTNSLNMLFIACSRIKGLSRLIHAMAKQSGSLLIFKA